MNVPAPYPYPSALTPILTQKKPAPIGAGFSISEIVSKVAPALILTPYALSNGDFFNGFFFFHFDLRQFNGQNSVGIRCVDGFSVDRFGQTEAALE